jgi:hypothetical protein
MIGRGKDRIPSAAIFIDSLATLPNEKQTAVKSNAYDLHYYSSNSWDALLQIRYAPWELLYYFKAGLTSESGPILIYYCTTIARKPFPGFYRTNAPDDESCVYQLHCLLHNLSFNNPLVCILNHVDADNLSRNAHGLRFLPLALAGFRQST